MTQRTGRHQSAEAISHRRQTVNEHTHAGEPGAERVTCITTPGRRMQCTTLDCTARDKARHSDREETEQSRAMQWQCSAVTVQPATALSACHCPQSAAVCWAELTV